MSFWDVALTLITKEPAPALVAGALPRLLTGAVLAGRVSLTLGTEDALPALPAATKANKDL